MNNNNLRDVAKHREEIHKDHATSRPLSKDYEYIGLLGERTLADFLNVKMDLETRPGGDGGVDLTIYGQTVDIKTARKAFNLIVEKGKVNADIYVLGQYMDRFDAVVLIGWATGEQMKAAPCRDFGYGINNHYIPATGLYDMSELIHYSVSQIF